MYAQRHRIPGYWMQGCSHGKVGQIGRPSPATGLYMLFFMSSQVISRRRHSDFRLPCVLASVRAWSYSKILWTRYFYKPLAEILLNLRLKCSWRQRWTNLIYWNQKVKVKVTTRPNLVKNHNSRRRRPPSLLVTDTKVLQQSLWPCWVAFWSPLSVAQLKLD